MTKAKWFATFASAAVLTLAPYATVAQGADEMREGIDVESPAEIARAHAKIDALFNDAVQPEALSPSEQIQILSKYGHIDPRNEVPTDLLKTALLYFDKNQDKFSNKNYIAIVDFKPRSDKYRLFIINIASGAVEKYHTTHGLHSDKNGYAVAFGNVVNSGKSSLGFIRTDHDYVGKFGRAVRLDGLSSTNSNVRERAVVFHGWDEVHEKNVIQGLSWGCITLDYAIRDHVLDEMQDGALMYVGVSKVK
jgi:hypothetical protein